MASLIIADVYFVSNRNTRERQSWWGWIIADVYFVSNRNTAAAIKRIN